MNRRTKIHKARPVAKIRARIKVFSRTTRKAIQELQAGKGRRFKSAKALFKDLGV
jgi:hypothetical protein